MNNISVIILVLVLMILGHLIADYPLQGWLAQAKAKSYWANSKPENQHDYIPALIGHAVMWGIIVCLPLMFDFQKGGVAYLDWFWLAVPVNIAVHAVVDDLKANRHKINLWHDQLFHLGQILITWGLWVWLFGSK